ncbi:protein of unassigned function [Methylobacterium oryzae CBMB20]|uniref:Protein of unassigned function n=1 Tax=Methylobacterium oryzae CBMB20 TaxID=693986 RepID=A0A089Q612_9HYPH|nr:protein of unassigned function [Methylobacterium oryzae CBMB20]
MKLRQSPAVEPDDTLPGDLGNDLIRRKNISHLSCSETVKRT